MWPISRRRSGYAGACFHTLRYRWLKQIHKTQWYAFFIIGGFWPIMFDVTIVSLETIVTPDLIGQNQH